MVGVMVEVVVGVTVEVTVGVMVVVMVRVMVGVRLGWFVILNIAYVVMIITPRLRAQRQATGSPSC